jgi:hypothetical protein
MIQSMFVFLSEGAARPSSAVAPWVLIELLCVFACGAHITK